MSDAPLPMFPLSSVLFPYAAMSLHVFEPRYRSMMQHCLNADRRFGVVLIERGSEVGGGDQRARVGTRAVIVRAGELPDGRWLLQVLGEAAVEVAEWLPDDPFPQARVHEVPDGPAPPGDVAELVAATTGRVRRARALLAEQGGAPPLPPDLALDGDGDAAVAAWQLCGAAPLSAYDAQRLLAVPATAERLRLLSGLMDELEVDLQRLLASE